MTGGRHHGFPRDYRLLTTEDFATTKRGGHRLVTRRFILYVAEARMADSRLGIVASRKVGMAVRRNRSKRVLREVFRQHRPQFQAPVDVVAIIKRVDSEPTYRDYERDFLYGIRTYFKRRRART